VFFNLQNHHAKTMQNTTIPHPFTTKTPQKITLKITYPQTLSFKASRQTSRNFLIAKSSQSPNLPKSRLFLVTWRGQPAAASSGVLNA
jgi:hypothetical protein